MLAGGAGSAAWCLRKELRGLMVEGEWVNPWCLVNCQGCNAERCCWEMARDDFTEGYQCQCTVFEEEASA